MRFFSRKKNEDIKNNDNFGGFLVSKNIMAGKPVRYSFREKSSIPQLNGWNLYSADDDEEYISNPQNFEIMSAETMSEYAPVMLEIFNAPYGTDLCWLYTEGAHTGFYDLANDKETDISEILK